LQQHGFSSLSIGSGIPAPESAGSDFLIVSFRNVICGVGFLDNFLFIISFIISVLFFGGGIF
jgi:hypothetical protein